MKTLAAIFDRLKLGNPVLYAIVVSLLIGIDSLLRELLLIDSISDTWQAVIRVASQLVVITLGAIGSRTTKFVKDDSNNKQ